MEIYFLNQLKLDRYLYKLCSKSNFRLTNLRIMIWYLEFQNKLLATVFFKSLCGLVWMLRSSHINTEINRFHWKPFGPILHDYSEAFGKLLRGGRLFAIRENIIRNLIIHKKITTSYLIQYNIIGQIRSITTLSPFAMFIKKVYVTYWTCNISSKFRYLLVVNYRATWLLISSLKNKKKFLL